MTVLRPLLLAAALCAAAALARAEGDPATGKLLYASRCAVCHSVDYNGVGPSHKAIDGRRAGTFPGYSYSKALRESSVVWNEQTLKQWLADPEKLIPGQKMFFWIPDAKERDDIVAYLLATSRQQASTHRKPGE